MQFCVCAPFQRKHFSVPVSEREKRELIQLNLNTLAVVVLLPIGCQMEIDLGRFNHHREAVVGGEVLLWSVHTSKQRWPLGTSPPLPSPAAAIVAGKLWTSLGAVCPPSVDTPLVDHKCHNKPKQAVEHHTNWQLLLPSVLISCASVPWPSEPS